MSCYCKITGLFGYNEFFHNSSLLKTEDTLHKWDIPRHTPICGLFQSEMPVFTADFSTTQALICREISSTLLLVVLVARSSFPRMIGSSTTLSPIIGDFVQKKKRKSKFHRHNCTRHLIYARACIRRDFFIPTQPDRTYLG